MGMSSLTFTMQVSAQATCQNNLTPSAAGPVSNNSSPLAKYTAGTAAANAAVGGANESCLFITSITASSSAIIDYQSLTDLLNTAGVNLVRIKMIWHTLLNASLDSVNGTSASSVTIGNNGANDWISQSNTGWFGSNTSTLVIPNGGFVAFGTPSAGGVTVDNTHHVCKAVNADANYSAKLQTTLCGADS